MCIYIYIYIHIHDLKLVLNQFNTCIWHVFSMILDGWLVEYDWTTTDLFGFSFSQYQLSGQLSFRKERTNLMMNGWSTCPWLAGTNPGCWHMNTVKAWTFNIFRHIWNIYSYVYIRLYNYIYIYINQYIQLLDSQIVNPGSSLNHAISIWIHGIHLRVNQEPGTWQLGTSFRILSSDTKASWTFFSTTSRFRTHFKAYLYFRLCTGRYSKCYFKCTTLVVVLHGTTMYAVYVYVCVYIYIYIQKGIYISIV